MSNKKLMPDNFYIEIKDFLLSGRGGKTTYEIASKFKLSNRQVGAIMGNLKKKDLIYTYTKGYVVFTNELSGLPEHHTILNSFYEWKGN